MVWSENVKEGGKTYPAFYDWLVARPGEINNVTILTSRWEVKTNVLAIMIHWENKIVVPWQMIPEESTWAYILAWI